ncbi:MAG: hypothetical protein RR846_07090 [Oscillospiraceae bacterium]
MVAFVQKAHGSIGTKTHGSRFAVLSSVVIFTKRSALRLVLFTYCYVSFYKLIGLHNPQGIRRIFDNLNPRHPPKLTVGLALCVFHSLCGKAVACLAITMLLYTDLRKKSMCFFYYL